MISGGVIIEEGQDTRFKLAAVASLKRQQLDLWLDTFRRRQPGAWRYLSPQLLNAGVYNRMTRHWPNCTPATAGVGWQPQLPECESR